LIIVYLNERYTMNFETQIRFELFEKSVEPEEDKLATYASLLCILYDKMKCEEEILFFYKNVPQIIEYLKANVRVQARKPFIDALLLLTSDLRYQTL
jgi:hypothetical protein